MSKGLLEFIAFFIGVGVTALISSIPVLVALAAFYLFGEFYG